MSGKLNKSQRFTVMYVIKGFDDPQRSLVK